MITPPEDISEKIKEIGNNFNHDVVKEIYSIYIPLLRKINNDHIHTKKFDVWNNNRNIIRYSLFKDTNKKYAGSNLFAWRRFHWRK